MYIQFLLNSHLELIELFYFIELSKRQMPALTQHEEYMRRHFPVSGEALYCFQQVGTVLPSLHNPMASNDLIGGHKTLLSRE